MRSYHSRLYLLSFYFCPAVGAFKMLLRVIVSSQEIRRVTSRVQKSHPDLQLLDKIISVRFSQRRKEIIGDEPLISVVMDRWLALFNQRQISAEFHKIVTTDLLQSFLDGLDAFVPSLLELYKAAVSSSRRLSLSSVKQCLHKEDTNQNRRTAALLGLPHFFSEDTSEIIKMCDVISTTHHWTASYLNRLYPQHITGRRATSTGKE